jgi:hypothetical protein
MSAFSQPGRVLVPRATGASSWDICGLVTPMTPNGNRYFILHVDDLSQFMWINVLQSKDVAAVAIK